MEEIERAGSKRLTTSLQYSNGMVRISIESLKTLGNPEYVTILVNESSNQISFLPSAKTDKAALMVKYDKLRTNRGMMIYSCNLVRKIFDIEGWDHEYRYRIPGHYYEEANVIYFDLKKAHKVEHNELLFAKGD